MLPGFVPAVKAVSTVAATAGIGSYARRRGALPQTTVKSLEKMIAEVFTPSIVFVKVPLATAGPCMVQSRSFSADPVVGPVRPLPKTVCDPAVACLFCMSLGDS